MRWKCTVAYDGTSFEGWQSQPGGNTVQDLIQKRLSQLMERPVTIHGAGRTDSGVHAKGQVFHFDADWSHGSGKLLRALRTGYPDSIHVHAAEEAAPDFHARYSAVNKRYTYTWQEGQADPFTTRWRFSTGNRRLDVARMNRAAGFLLGEHDFSAFTCNPGEERDDNPVRELNVLRIHRDGPVVMLETEARSFLFRMVRSLAGCLFDVGIGKLEPAQVMEILATGKRTHLVQTAPARGLCLEQVWY